MIGALALELVAMLVFLFAPSIGWLIAARIVQGVATGAASRSAAMVAILVAAGAPTPLWPIYQHDWGLQPWLLTLAFGVYALSRDGLSAIVAGVVIGVTGIAATATGFGVVTADVGLSGVVLTVRKR
ncbi:hypothetical protein [Lentzea roselyniae]